MVWSKVQLEKNFLVSLSVSRQVIWWSSPVLSCPVHSMAYIDLINKKLYTTITMEWKEIGGGQTLSIGDSLSSLHDSIQRRVFAYLIIDLHSMWVIWFVEPFISFCLFYPPLLSMETIIILDQRLLLRHPHIVLLVKIGSGNECLSQRPLIRRL